MKIKSCSIENCLNRYWAKGYCRNHYLNAFPLIKEKEKQFVRDWHLKNKERMREVRKIYYILNREQIRERQRKYYIDNNEYEKHKFRYKRNAAIRQAIEQGLSKLTSKTIQMVYEDNIKKYGTLTCVYCLLPIPFGYDSLEHTQPLSRGGSNEYGNLAIVCRKCNYSKGYKTAEEYQKYLIFVAKHKKRGLIYA